MSPLPPRRFSFGTQTLTPTRVAFRLWAPSCAAVSLLIEHREPLAMTATRAGWFELATECGAGSRYRFVLEDGQQVPDPASRQQDIDAHGWSVVVDPNAFRWRHDDWLGRPWNEAVIYELHVGIYGGFAGVTAKLAELAALGVTAVELMPIAQFPGARNWGYDGVLPFAPAAAYGTPDELKTLIDTAHGLGLMVLLDVVYNHFGPDGNFLHAYAKEFFREDKQTGWGAALDFRRKPVREFFIENALYWLLEYRFDGLRLDAVHAIGDPDFLLELAHRVREMAPPPRQVHLIVENEDNSARLLDDEIAQGFDAQWNDDGHHCLHVLLTGEQEGYYADYGGDTSARLARCLAEGFVYQGEHSAHCGRERGEPSYALRPTAFVLFLQNHDHIGNRAFGERLLSLSRADAFRAAAALVLLSPQIPLLFMGEEIGAREPFLFFTDHRPELAELVRDGRRREFAKFAAFAQNENGRTLPDPNDVATFEASRPQTNPESALWRAFYRDLLSLRREHVVPGLAQVNLRESKALGRAAVSVAWRSGDGWLRLYTNLDELSIPVPVRPAARLLYASTDEAGSDFEKGLLAGGSTLLFSEPIKPAPESAVA